MSTQTAQATTGTYVIDTIHSQIGFGARHAMVTKVRGTFNDFSGGGFFDAQTPANSNLELIIEAASFDTRNSDRDAHLRSNDFFNMEAFPEITFTSTAFENIAADTFRVSGDLSIKGVTKAVVFDVAYTGSAVDPYQNQRIGFEGKLTIDRRDGGINFNAALETGGILVGEKITLEFEISAIRSAEAA